MTRNLRGVLLSVLFFGCACGLARPVIATAVPLRGFNIALLFGAAAFALWAISRLGLLKRTDDSSHFLPMAPRWRTLFTLVYSAAIGCAAGDIGI